MSKLKLFNKKTSCPTTKNTRRNSKAQRALREKLELEEKFNKLSALLTAADNLLSNETGENFFKLTKALDQYVGDSASFVSQQAAVSFAVDYKCDVDGCRRKLQARRDALKANLIQYQYQQKSAKVPSEEAKKQNSQNGVDDSDDSDNNDDNNYDEKDATGFVYSM